MRSWLARATRALGRIWVRLLVVNVIVVLVPLVGLEFARLYEKQLLDALQRDMQNQATLVARLCESELTRGQELGAPHQAPILRRAARRTRTRIRLLDGDRGVVADSHADGAPEGAEPPTPLLVHAFEVGAGRRIPAVTPRPLLRREVQDAFAGNPSAYTRTAVDPPAVFLFVTEPVRHEGEVTGVVYVVRSTTPVLMELHRIRKGLIRVLLISIALTALLTLLLAWTISRPLARLARAARRIADGQRNVTVPTSGGGEISELGHAFSVMTQRLDARLRYISEFAADVAHEFKSPLTSIRGAAELLAEGAADEPEARRRFLGNIELDAQRLDRLVSRLLELSRIEASDTAPAVLDLPELLKRLLGRTAQIPRLEYLATANVVLAREAELEAAVGNLLDNAQRFAPHPDGVTVRVTDAPNKRRAVAIAVIDHGPGVPEENLDKVFERFFTTDEDRNGTGLGLAIVQSVAERHGGTVHVEPTPGGGATFVLSLPVGL